MEDEIDHCKAGAPGEGVRAVMDGSVQEHAQSSMVSQSDKTRKAALMHELVAIVLASTTFLLHVRLACQPSRSDLSRSTSTWSQIGSRDPPTSTAPHESTEMASHRSMRM